MPLTDTDAISSPADMVVLLRRLPKIIREYDVLPTETQQRFWDDVNRLLAAQPIDEVQLPDVSLESVSVVFSILSSMFGQRLVDMVNGETQKYNEQLLAQMKTATHRSWDAFLDQKFAETEGTDHAGSLRVSVHLDTAINASGGQMRGSLCRVDGVPGILKLTAGTKEPLERYFESKDIVMLEFLP